MMYTKQNKIIVKLFSVFSYLILGNVKEKRFQITITTKELSTAERWTKTLEDVARTSFLTVMAVMLTFLTRASSMASRRFLQLCVKIEKILAKMVMAALNRSQIFY